MDRAYALLEIKAVDDPAAPGAKRTFRGIATTPSPDRYSDRVEPKGAQFKLPIPLLWQHSSAQPIGWVTAAKVTDAGIEIEGEVADIPEEGDLKNQLATYWQYIKNKLVRGLSIGFTSLERSWDDTLQGYHFLKWEWLELSAVTIPANADCTVTTIKAFDRPNLQRAALGQRAAAGARASRQPPGVSGTTNLTTTTSTTPEGKIPMDISKQINAKKAERDLLMKRATDLLEKKTGATSAEDFTEEEETEYADTMKTVESIDVDIKRMEKHQALMAAGSEPIAAPGAGREVATVDEAAAARSAVAGASILSVRRNLPKGTGFTRLAMAMAHSKGNMSQAVKIAQRWKKETPEVFEILSFAENMGLGNTDFKKAASDFGVTTDATWAQPLVYYENLASEFIDLLRPATIIGRLTNLRRVPFNIRIAGKTSGSTVGWVGEGAPKPVGELAFNAVNLGHAKAAGIIVMSMELARFSSPSAEQLVRTDLIDAMSQFLDQQFIDPAIAAVANVSPASILNGITSVPSSGTTIAAITTDVTALMQTFLASEMDPSQGVWIMKPTTAMRLGMIRTSQDAFAFPDINAKGGEFFGLPVVVSNSVPGSASGGSLIALVVQNEIFFADDGGVSIDVSQEASVQMNTAPSAGAQSLVSLWQNNLVGIRAERMINWQRRRDTAVGYIDGFGH